MLLNAQSSEQTFAGKITVTSFSNFKYIAGIQSYIESDAKKSDLNIFSVELKTEFMKLNLQ